MKMVAKKSFYNYVIFTNAKKQTTASKIPRLHGFEYVAIFDLPYLTRYVRHPTAYPIHYTGPTLYMS